MRPSARVLWETVTGPQRRKFYHVQCACGRACKFWRWSWLTRGAERCRGCHGIVLAPTASPMLALLVVTAPTVGEFWGHMDWDDQVAAVRKLVRDLVDGALVEAIGEITPLEACGVVR